MLSQDEEKRTHVCRQGYVVCVPAMKFTSAHHVCTS